MYKIYLYIIVSVFIFIEEEGKEDSVVTSRDISPMAEKGNKIGLINVLAEFIIIICYIRCMYGKLYCMVVTNFWISASLAGRNTILSTIAVQPIAILYAFNIIYASYFDCGKLVYKRRTLTIVSHATIYHLIFADNPRIIFPTIGTLPLNPKRVCTRILQNRRPTVGLYLRAQSIQLYEVTCNLYV